MKTYKDCELEYLGSSDISTLIMAGCDEEGLKIKPLHFGGDNVYSAYIVEGEDVEIGSHYKKIETFKYWLKIYDDSRLQYKIHAKEINVYRAGDYGCIIQVIY